MRHRTRTTTTGSGTPRRLRIRAGVAAAVTALASLVALIPEHPALGQTTPVTVRLGYFPNVTHAPALVAADQGIFAKNLGSNPLEIKTFNAGPEEVTALLSDALDIGYIGPNPAVNAYVQSGGEAVRVVSGAASGGAFLIAKPGIDKPADLKGKKVASPQLGNTQDVALRVWLKEHGLKTDTQGGGDVSILPQDNATTLSAFSQGQIDAAWVIEPWATRLITEGGGHVLVDERDLWPDGRYATTNIIVRTEFLKEHPEVVKQVLQANIEAIAAIETNREAAETSVANQIQKITGKAIAAPLVRASFSTITFTEDPIPYSLQKSAKDAVSVGLLQPPKDLFKIYDLKLVNQLRKAAGDPAITVKAVKIPKASATTTPTTAAAGSTSTTTTAK